MQPNERPSQFFVIRVTVIRVTCNVIWRSLGKLIPRLGNNIAEPASQIGI